MYVVARLARLKMCVSGPAFCSLASKNENVIIQIEGNFLKIAKIIPARKTSFSQSQKLVPAKHKNLPFANLNSRKNLLLRGKL